MNDHIKKEHPDELVDDESVTSSRSLLEYLPRKMGSTHNAHSNDLLADFFACAHLSLNIVAHMKLDLFCKSLNGSYHLPSRRTLSRIIKDKAHAILVRNEKLLDDADVINLTTDVWSSNNSVLSMIGVTAHFYDKNEKKRKDIILDLVELESSHTAQSLKDAIIKCVPINCMAKVKNIVTDGATNVIKMCQLLGKKNFHCGAHKINLIVQSSLKTQPLQNHLTRLRSFIKKLKRSSPLRHIMKKDCEDRGVKYIQPFSDCHIRWSSTFFMLENYLSLIDVYDSLMLREDCQIFTRRDKMFLTNVKNMLALFEQETRKVSVSSESISCLLPLGKMIRYNLNNFKQQEQYQDEDTQNFIQSLYTSTACFLDPRFSFLTNILSLSEWEKVEREIKEQLAGRNHDTNNNVSNVQVTDVFWQDFLQPGPNNVAATDWNAELIQYKLTVLGSRVTLESSPILWWTDHQSCFPNLFKLAMEYLTIPSGSVECERMFSIVGMYFGNKRRSLLSADTTRSFLLIASDQKEARDRFWKCQYQTFDNQSELEENAYDSDNDSCYSEEL